MEGNSLEPAAGPPQGGLRPLGGQRGRVAPSVGALHRERRIVLGAPPRERSGLARLVMVQPLMPNGTEKSQQDSQQAKRAGAAHYLDFFQAPAAGKPS